MLPRRRAARNVCDVRVAASLLEHVVSGRVRERSVPRTRRTHLRWRYGRTRARVEPANPLGPPRPFFLVCEGEPTLRIDMAVIVALGRHTITPTRVPRLRHH